MADHFPENGQVSATELDAKAGWRTIPGWDVGTHQQILEMVERKGLIEVDRHMEPWLICPKVKTEAAWKQIYDDLM
jgi:hypothetical protein